MCKDIEQCCSSVSGTAGCICFCQKFRLKTDFSRAHSLSNFELLKYQKLRLKSDFSRADSLFNFELLKYETTSGMII